MRRAPRRDDLGSPVRSACRTMPRSSRGGCATQTTGAPAVRIAESPRRCARSPRAPGWARPVCAPPTAATRRGDPFSQVKLSITNMFIISGGMTVSSGYSQLVSGGEERSNGSLRPPGVGPLEAARRSHHLGRSIPGRSDSTGTTPAPGGPRRAGHVHLRTSALIGKARGFSTVGRSAVDGTRARRTRDKVRQAWYARQRQRRFARFLGFEEKPRDAASSPTADAGRTAAA